MKTVLLHFEESFRQLLPRGWRDLGGALLFNGHQSAKHLVEALGVPHTEVGWVRVNGTPMGLDYLVCDGDDIEVFNAIRRTAADEPRFGIDGHLGRLNAGLRMLGLDCAYCGDTADDELVSMSAQENRIILTRDRHLLMRKSVSAGYLVRALDPKQQLREVVTKFGLRPWFQPFRRCIRCNGLLRAISKEEVLDRLQPLTRLYFDDFRFCPSCEQIYWKGSHFAQLQEIVTKLEAMDPDGS